LFSIKKQTELIELELENKLLENDRLAIYALEKEKELENNRLWVIILLLIVAGISFTLLIVLWYHKKNIELKNSLKETNDQLKLANDFKSELISIIGHDMYNMISPLSGFFNLINNKHMSMDEFLSVAPMLEDNTEYLQLMFSNLQKWAESQHDSKMTNPQIVSMHELSEELALLFGSRLNVTNLTFTTNITISPILFDENHLKHILRNLIHNAIKYTPDGGNITLFCTQDVSSNRIICGVSDTGKGLSAETVHKILEEQTRFTNPGIRSEKGTGLGLMTIKRFLELNNSRLHITSEVGKGSTFYFEVLPVLEKN
jgi:signal transduction histidine kinase